jgi:hypothetical protein
MTTVIPFTRKSIKEAVDGLVGGLRQELFYDTYLRDGEEDRQVDTFQFPPVDGIVSKIMIDQDGIQAVIIKGVVPRSIGGRLEAYGYFHVTHCNDGKSMITASFKSEAGLSLARDNIFALSALTDL